MLEQQGINVATVGIIPVKLDIDYKKIIQEMIIYLKLIIYRVYTLILIIL